MAVYTPVFASPSDSSSITLCKILDVLASNSGSEQAPVVGSISTGSGTLVVNTADISTLAFSTTAASSGTIGISASVDGTNYIATSYTALASGGTSANFNASTATIGQINTVGLSYVKFTATSLVGSTTITTVGANGVSNVMLDNPLPTGSNVIGVVGTQAANGAVTFSGGTATSATGVSLGVSPTKSLTIQNTSTGSAILYVSTTSGTLTNVNSINIAAGVGYQFPFIPSGTIYIGASASCTYSFWYA
jgi:hypothetical protein